MCFYCSICDSKIDIRKGERFVSVRIGISWTLCSKCAEENPRETKYQRRKLQKLILKNARLKRGKQNAN
jgi:hypothetical protein